MEDYSLINTTLTKDLFDLPANSSDYLMESRKTRWDKAPIGSSLLGNLMSSNNTNTKSSRKSRWGSEYEKTFTPLPVTSIPENLDVDTFENLLRRQRLEDINRRIAMNEWEDNDPDLKSPSPEPIYDSKTGKRLNTRQVINKEKYIREKTELIGDLIKYDKHYQPPLDYKPPKKVKMMYIKGNEKFNFTRMIIGPKGETQKKLEELSHCKISIRGKGSNWNSNSYEKSYLDEMEPLHVYIQAETDEDLKKGEEIIGPLLDENSEEFKKQKMAVANIMGYNTEHACEFCGERGHKSWACPKNIGQFTKVEIKCRYCGDKGHPSCDCPMKPEEKIDYKREMEIEVTQFFREIEEFNEKKSVLILEPEIKAGDIRKSVLVTGKIPENLLRMPLDSNDNVIIKKEVKEKNNTISYNTDEDVVMKNKISKQPFPNIKPIILNQNIIRPYNHSIMNLATTQQQGANHQQSQEQQPQIIPPITNIDSNAPLDMYSHYLNLQNKINPNGTVSLNSNSTTNLQQTIQPKPTSEFNIPNQPIANNPNIKKANPIAYNYGQMAPINPMNIGQLNPMTVPISPITGLPIQVPMQGMQGVPYPLMQPQQNLFPYHSHHRSHYNRNYHNATLQGKIPPSFGLSKSLYHSPYYKNFGLNNFTSQQVKMSYGVIPSLKKESDTKAKTDTVNSESNVNANTNEDVNMNEGDDEDIQIEKID